MYMFVYTYMVYGFLIETDRSSYLARFGAIEFHEGATKAH